MAFMNGIRPLALLKRLKEIPTTTLKATIARFHLITTSEAEVALINIKEGTNRQTTLQPNGPKQHPPPPKRSSNPNPNPSPLRKFCTEGGGFHPTNKCGTKPSQFCKLLGFDFDHAPINCDKMKTQKNISQKAANNAAKKSAILEDDNYSDDSVRKPALIDSGCSGMYTPIRSDLDTNFFTQHARHDRRERIEDASGVILKSTCTGTIAGKPAYLVPGLTETLLSAHVICQPNCPQNIDDIFLLTTSDAVYCIEILVQINF